MIRHARPCKCRHCTEVRPRRQREWQAKYHRGYRRGMSGREPKERSAVYMMGWEAGWRKRAREG